RSDGSGPAVAAPWRSEVSASVRFTEIVDRVRRALPTIGAAERPLEMTELRGEPRELRPEHADPGPLRRVGAERAREDLGELPELGAGAELCDAWRQPVVREVLPDDVEHVLRVEEDLARERLEREARERVGVRREGALRLAIVVPHLGRGVDGVAALLPDG